MKFCQIGSEITA